MPNPFCYLNLISDLFLETARTCSNSNSQLTWWNNLKILSPRNLSKFRLSFLSDKNFCWLASAPRHSRHTKWTTLNFHIGILLFKIIHKLWIVIVTPVGIKLIVTNPIHFGPGCRNNHRLNGCRWTWSISVLNQDCLFRLKSFNNRTSSIYMIHIIWTSSILSRSRLLHIIRYYWRLNYIAESNSLIASCGMIYAIKTWLALSRYRLFQT